VLLPLLRGTQGVAPGQGASSHSQIWNVGAGVHPDSSARNCWLDGPWPSADNHSVRGLRKRKRVTQHRERRIV